MSTMTKEQAQQILVSIYKVATQAKLSKQEHDAVAKATQGLAEYLESTEVKTNDEVKDGDSNST